MVVLDEYHSRCWSISQVQNRSELAASSSGVNGSQVTDEWYADEEPLRERTVFSAPQR